jgi:hypothetical protein
LYIFIIFAIAFVGCIPNSKYIKVNNKPYQGFSIGKYKSQTKINIKINTATIFQKIKISLQLKLKCAFSAKYTGEWGYKN